MCANMSPHLDARHAGVLRHKDLLTPEAQQLCSMNSTVTHLKRFLEKLNKNIPKFYFILPSMKHGCSMLKNKAVILFPWQPAQEDGSEALPERLTQR